MKYIFTGGGTLGHTNPAIAVAEKCRQIDTNAEILFLTRKGGDENRIITEHGFKFWEFPAIGMDRGTFNKAKLCLTTLKALSSCIKKINTYSPNVIFGTGGYVSFAPLVSGIILKIPTYIHESNMTPGLVTKIVSLLGAHVLLNFEGSTSKFKNKNVTVVGNPILEDFSKISKKSARKKLKIDDSEIFIVSFGGSGGSKALNDNIIEFMEKYSSKKRNIRHLHATGKKYFEDYKKKCIGWSKIETGCKIVSHINDMPIVMNAADIVICRCGSMTLTELAASKTASILIPSPNVSDNHQYFNAKYLADRNAAILVEEKNLTSQTLIEKTELLTSSENTRILIENEILKTVKKDPSATIANLLMNN